MLFAKRFLIARISGEYLFPSSWNITIILGDMCNEMCKVVHFKSFNSLSYKAQQQRRGIGSNYIKPYYILLPQPSQQQRRWNGSNYIKLYYILLSQPPQQQRRWNGSNYIKLYYILLSLFRISSDSFPE